jgi:segregation and condensation protein A
VTAPLERPVLPVPPAATPGASVSFDHARQPGSAVVVHVERFDGPLALLLALIEQRQLDVLTVPLGDLTAAYLDALASLPGERLQNISGFIAVASQLILIKSRALLPRAPITAVPSPDAEDPERALRERLLLYRTYRDVAARLGVRLEEARALFHREPSIAQAAAQAGARPPAAPRMDPALLVAALTRSIAFVPPPEPPPEIVPRAVTLVDRAEAIRRSLVHAPQVVLQELLAGVTDRVVIAVTFLAMLELVKGRELVVEQHEPWGPIHCRATTDDEKRPRPRDDAPGEGTVTPDPGGEVPAT